MKIRNHEFDFERHTYVCGILNVTPDSFSDGGSYKDVDAAVERAMQMAEEGAALIDVGGESTRPGHATVPEDVEAARVLPVLEAIRRVSDIPLSVDTRRASLAAAALDAGADLVNDVSCLADPAMPALIAARGCPYCLMHNRVIDDGQRLQVNQVDGGYGGFLRDVGDDLRRAIDTLHQAGVADRQLILDPGIGFAKSHAQNLELMRHLSVVTNLGYPVLLGISRKSVVGLALDLPVSERLEGTLALNVYGMLHGCAILRVHDVREHVRAVRMLEALRGAAD